MVIFLTFIVIFSYMIIADCNLSDKFKTNFSIILNLIMMNMFKMYLKPSLCGWFIVNMSYLLEIEECLYCYYYISYQYNEGVNFSNLIKIFRINFELVIYSINYILSLFNFLIKKYNDCSKKLHKNKLSHKSIYVKINYYNFFRII